MRIDVLPDDVLLHIFDFYVNINFSRRDKTAIEEWQSLVHVCQRWRNIVFGSQRRLNLRLACTSKTPTRHTLDVWPALPLLINSYVSLPSGADNIIVALGQSNRVCQVNLSGIAHRQLEKVLAAMQVPFPELTELSLLSAGGLGTPPVAPDSFLGGSAPHLRYFRLSGIPFPGLPKLRLSATHLVFLSLLSIPHSGYISPEAMAALLPVLSSLQMLYLEFQSPRSCPDWVNRPQPPSKRSVISALTYFSFKGVIEYLEDLVTFIDAPLLRDLRITFFNQIDFIGPRLARFISRTPILADCNAHVEFDDITAYVRLAHAFKRFEIRISCKEQDWQLSSVAQVCNNCLPPLSMIEDLYIHHIYSHLVWTNDAIENTLWLELLLPFTAVKNLCLSKHFAPGVTAALQEVVGTEVLPSLQNIFVQGLEPSGPIQENIGQFVAT